MEVLHLSARARASALLAALSLTAVVGGCGGDDDSGDEGGQELKVGYAFGFDVGDTGDQIAFDRLAEETDVEPIFEETGGGAEAVAALSRGDIDMAKIPFDDAVNAIGEGADLRLLLPANHRQDILLAGGPEITDLADLRGSNILLERPGPSISAATLPEVLEEAGLQEGDYEVGFLADSQNRSAALASGRADAATLESADLELTDTKLNLLAEMGSRAPPPGNVFAVLDDLIEEDPALLEQVVRELLAGYESLYAPGGREAWIEKARDENLTEEPEEVAARIYEANRELDYWPRGAPYTAQQHQRALDFYLEAGVVEDPVAFEQVWDTSFWERAAGS